MYEKQGTEMRGEVANKNRVLINKHHPFSLDQDKIEFKQAEA